VRPRESAIIFRDLIGKLAVFRVERDKCRSVRPLPTRPSCRAASVNSVATPLWLGISKEVGVVRQIALLCPNSRNARARFSAEAHRDRSPVFDLQSGKQLI
jgi:hypothetical protein